MRHTIFVPQAELPETLQSVGEALRIADWVTPYLRRRGADLTVWHVRPFDLGNPRVIAAFKLRRIESLPALIAGPIAIVGCAAIEGYYRGLVAGDTAADYEVTASDDRIRNNDPNFRINSRNRGRPNLGKLSSAATAVPATAVPAINAQDAMYAAVSTEEDSGEDMLAAFYGREVDAFQKGTPDDYEFGTPLG